MNAGIAQVVNGCNSVRTEAPRLNRLDWVHSRLHEPSPAPLNTAHADKATPAIMERLDGSGAAVASAVKAKFCRTLERVTSIGAIEVQHSSQNFKFGSK